MKYHCSTDTLTWTIHLCLFRTEQIYKKLLISPPNVLFTSVTQALIVHRVISSSQLAYSSLCKRCKRTLYNLRSTFPLNLKSQTSQQSVPPNPPPPNLPSPLSVCQDHQFSFTALTSIAILTLAVRRLVGAGPVGLLGSS